MPTKSCSKCKEIKDYSEFHKDLTRAIGIRPACKACETKRLYEWREKNRSAYNNYAAQWRALNPERQHATEIKRKYNVSKEQYQEMLDKQGNRCQICRKLHNVDIKRGRLYIDHNHTTGKVRGLLCNNCNSGIGNLQDDPDIVQSALEYLKCQSDPL
jgi:Autographiviridae endonuclease VII